MLMSQKQRNSSLIAEFLLIQIQERQLSSLTSLFQIYKIKQTLNASDLLCLTFKNPY